jgi:Right handed beta helix region
MAVQLANGRNQFFAADGTFLVGGKVYTYVPGTSTPKATYTTSAGTTPKANPIILDARGEAQIYWSGAYDVVLKDAADATIWGPERLEEPEEAGAADSVRADLASASDATKGPGLIQFGPSVAYAAKTLGAALQDSIPSLMWFVTSEAERAAIKAGTSTTDYSATITTALALSPKLLIPEGEWNCADDVILADSESLVGLGMYGKSILQFASGKGIKLPSTSGRNEIMGLDIRGTSNTGSGIRIGDTSFSGKHSIRFNRISGFDTGIECAGALYTLIEHNWIVGNLRGIDFKAGGGSLFNTTVWIRNNDISDNTTGGITASNVPIRNQSISIRYNAFERNASTTPASTAQVTIGSMESWEVSHNYFEDKDAAHTTKPAGLDFTAATVGEIAFNRFDEMRICINSGTGSVDYVDIHHNRCLSTVTSDYVINGGVSASYIKLWSNTYSASQTLSGTKCYDYGVNLWAPWNADETSFTPTLRGSSTAGTPTVTTAVGRYTDLGKRRFFEARVTISAIGGMTGNLQLSGLPGARATTTGLGSQVICQYDGITLSAGRTELVGEIASGSSVVDLYQCGSGVATLALPISGVASATTIVVSGSYPI